MPEIVSKYLKILRIELEELEKDIEALEELYRKKHSDREITNYVFLENVSLIQHEESGLKAFLHVLDGLDARSYAGLQPLIGDIEARFQAIVQASSIPEAIYGIVRRKIEKTSRYVLEP